MVRIFYFIITFTLSPLYMVAQNESELAEIIKECLLSYDRNMNVEDVSRNGQCEKYVCKDNLPPFFSYSATPEMIYFSLDNISVIPKIIRKKMSHGLQVLFVEYQLNGSQLQVAIFRKSVRKNRNKINIGTGDWTTFFYEFSCENLNWQLKDVKHHGI